MRVASLLLALPAVTFGLAVSAPDTANAFNAAAKANAYCMTCHGYRARGFRGFLTVPQIAGQQADYIKIQLEDFAAGRRSRDITFVKYSKVHGMSAGEREALAQYLSTLQPVPHPGGQRDLVALGDKIFHGGIPDHDVPACAVCHGPDAKGNMVFPRLAGQWSSYVINHLSNWDKKRGLDPNYDDNAKIMSPIASHLSKQEIQAVAAYVSSLK